MKTDTVTDVVDKLILVASDSIPGWFIIERAEHDGREFKRSARFSDADVEGTGEEMLALASAIEMRKTASFKRCMVDATSGSVRFRSPRNSQCDGLATLAAADDLAVQIRAKVQPVPT